RRSTCSPTSRAVSTGSVPRPSTVAIAPSDLRPRSLHASCPQAHRRHGHRSRNTSGSLGDALSASRAARRYQQYWSSHPTQRKTFSHPGNFFRHSTLGERKALWKKVAIDLKKLAKGDKVYVSTHGSGVHGVRVRLSM
ncbi:unnamed protein product, partial [Sphacelaria rigidula]